MKLFHDKEAYFLRLSFLLLLVGAPSFLSGGIVKEGVFVPKEGLSVEYRQSPVGIGASRPRLSWKIIADGTNIKQCAYRVLVAESRAALDAGIGDLWDSGKVASDQQLNIRYSGKPLVSGREVWWKVKVWDNVGRESTWSESAKFVTAVMAPSEWNASWIGPAAVTRPDANLGSAKWLIGSEIYRKEFVLDRALGDKEVVEFIHAAKGIHWIFVNGVLFYRPYLYMYEGKVFNWRQVRFRDIKPFLRTGKNEIKVCMDAADYTQSGFIGVMRFADEREIATDESWTGSAWDAQVLGDKATKLSVMNLSVTNTVTASGAMVARDRAAVDWTKELILREEVNSPAFEKRFAVKKGLKSAVLQITGMGLYEAFMNDRRIGDKLLDPAQTYYDKTVLYSTYLLTDLVKEGDNRLSVLLGHGWYDVRSISYWNYDVAPWRDFPRLLAQLELTYEDGTRETVVSDDSWRQIDSPVAYDCMREGEVIGAKHVRAVDLKKKVVFAEKVKGPAGRLKAQQMPGTKVREEIKPCAIYAVKEGGWQIVFPENIAGWIRLKMRGLEKGDVVTIRYDEFPVSEVRQIDALFFYPGSHLFCAENAALQTDRVIARGTGEEIYEPRFTYHGFQYVWVRGLKEKPKVEDVIAKVIHNDFRKISSFDCSSASLNRLLKMADRSYVSNYVNGFPTDCPHREKNGWTGDAAFTSELAQYLYENTACSEKWLCDIKDSQAADGSIPCCVPNSGHVMKACDGPDWANVLPILTWDLWIYRDDRQMLDEMYPTVVAYLNYLRSRETEIGLVSCGLGDWCSVGSERPSVAYCNSVFYYQAVKFASLMAREKGLLTDAAKFARWADENLAAVRKKFYRGKGVWDNGGQTAQALAVTHGLSAASERQATADRLIATVAEKGEHVDVGVHGMKNLFRALSIVGRTDLAFRVLTNETSPSLVDWIKAGGTSLWESFNGSGSHNHIMFGDFAAWAYEYLAGIRLATTEESTAAVPVVTGRAFKNLLIAPAFINELNFVKAEVDGPYGRIKSEWKREGGKIFVRVVLPPGVEATVRLTGQKEVKVGSGEWTWSF